MYYFDLVVSHLLERVQCVDPFTTSVLSVGPVGRDPGHQKSVYFGGEVDDLDP